jgi:predicted transcriptional regulator
MLNIPKKENMVSVSVRLSPEVVQHVRALAESLSMEHVSVTEGAVLRQIITDFFSRQGLLNVNSEGK